MVEERIPQAEQAVAVSSWSSWSSVASAGVLSGTWLIMVE